RRQPAGLLQLHAERLRRRHVRPAGSFLERAGALQVLRRGVRGPASAGPRQSLKVVSRRLVSLLNTPGVRLIHANTRSKVARLSVCSSATRSHLPLVLWRLATAGSPRSALTTEST